MFKMGRISRLKSITNSIFYRNIHTNFQFINKILIIKLCTDKFLSYIKISYNNLKPLKNKNKFSSFLTDHPKSKSHSANQSILPSIQIHSPSKKM